MLEQVKQASLTELRAEWQRRYGPAPALRSADLLRRVLAWRIQVDAEGGLRPETKKLLANRKKARQPILATGTRISRDWLGTTHEVEVVEGGFLYAGRKWKSLSHVAREITGTRWNGPRFFGLRTAR